MRTGWSSFSEAIKSDKLMSIADSVSSFPAGTPSKPAGVTAYTVWVGASRAIVSVKTQGPHDKPGTKIKAGDPVPYF